MTASVDALSEILDMARWAPSGDNTQPWRFERVSDHVVRIHGYDTRDHCVYDLDGHSSQLAHGTLLETLSIAASAQNMRATVELLSDADAARPVYEVIFQPDADMQPDPLLSEVPRRSVNRRALSMTRISAEHCHTLAAAAGPNFEVLWFEGQAKWRMAWLMFANAKLRLTLPEAYSVHRDIIEWNARFSTARVPDGALGLDRATLKLMHWVMGSWGRVRFFNTYLAGHLVPRLEMDLMPGVRCGAHFALICRSKMSGMNDYVSAGRAVQRLWLSASQLGIQLQPELTPLIFDRYVRDGRPFTADVAAKERAEKLVQKLHHILPAGLAGRTAFLGRVGYGEVAKSRSLRLTAQNLSKT